MPPRIRIRLRYNRRSDLTTVLAFALIFFSLLAYFGIVQKNAAASSPNAPSSTFASGLRQYYLTPLAYFGHEAPGANVCAAGYHFASLWEIAQTSTLIYNTSLGYIEADSGFGPPASKTGWIRTGSPSDGVKTDPPGQSNCNNWTSAFGTSGTVAAPQFDWAGSDLKAFTFLGWRVVTADCSIKTGVWCAQNTDTLTVVNDGSGSGTTSTVPSGSLFDDGTVVTITAAPAAGSSFAGWSDNCDTQGFDCQVTMTGNTTVTATFTLDPPGKVGLSVGRTGKGTVTSAPGGINCGRDCSGTFTTGSSVTLTAVPAPGWYFKAWSGLMKITINPLVVNMNGSRAVTATFATNRINLPIVVKP